MSIKKTNDNELNSRPSKSQHKREMKELHELGKELAELPLEILKNISIDEKLRDAIELKRRISNNEGKRRQLKYIEKLMREEDVNEIKLSLESLTFQRKTEDKTFHHLEQWRDQLIEDGDMALNKLLEEYDNLDRQHLRQLFRRAQAEASQKKPPTSSRAIFRYLREHIKLENI
ncbi:MAG: DUF615 domain-containing protein [Francisellaceae bacterium]|jgi:ribosome-associated protein|nr:DUF615 domain-containing protein [Francisellaceae bacterium]MBT6207060.1 DUF615 domain-containing protein [Francisellaceae bacterium]MBT6538592.1 DUF615 domain-containing protein [Francisellaceae bacterium]